MKSLITFISIGLIATSVNAQKLKDSDVPAAIKEAISKQYPGTKVEKWEKEDGNYEAELIINKNETSVLYDSKGTLLQTEVEIKPNELPKGVNDYTTTKLAGKKIKEASKITDSKGKVSYEAEIEGDDYMFDDKGNFIKKSEEKDKDEDDKK